MNNDAKYQRSGDYDCLKCPDPVLNGFAVVGVALLVIIFYLGLITLNIRKKKDSLVSILTRILTNYLQLVTTSLSFELRFPNGLVSALEPLNTIGNSNQSFLSFDCFVRDIEIKGPFPSNSIMKLFLLSLLPLILFAIVAMIWMIVKMVKSKWVPEMTRNLSISFITIVFLLHPALAFNSLSIFQCVKIDDGLSKVRIHTQME